MPPAKIEPGRDPDMANRTLKLNLVFALSSLGMLLVFSLMIWADYDREWKNYQSAFNRLEVKFTEQQIQEALGKVDAARRQAIQAELLQGDKEIAARRADVRTAGAEVEKAHGTWYGLDQEYRFTKANIDVKRYDYEEAAHRNAASAPRRKASLEALEKRWADLRVKVEEAKAAEDAAKAKVAELEATKLDAEKKQKELFTERDRLEEKLRKIRPGWVSFVRNLPILDMANPSLKISQIMPGSLVDDVNFTSTPKVDRCTTCHLAIDKKGFENAPQPFRTHPDFEVFLRGPHPIEKVGCTACHQGRGRATSFQNAAHTPTTREQEKEWGKYTHSKEYQELRYWDLQMMARGHTESQCLKCHSGAVEVPKAEHLNTGILLIEKYGCFGCHKIKGWEGLRKVGPDLTRVVTKTDPEWIVRWIKEPRGFRPTRMPQIWDVRLDETAGQKARNDTEANAVAAYVVTRSATDRYPDPPRGDLLAGRKIFESVGCLACHRVGDDRRGIVGLEAAAFREHGPNLAGTGSKVKAGWLYAWVRNPKGYWHDTKMPNLRLSEREAGDVTAYLMSLKNDAFLARPRPAFDKGLRDEIVLEYLKAQYTVKEADERLRAMADQERTLFLGEKTIGRYGCFGCHNIPGFEKTSPVGVELTEEGSKLVERLDFGFEEGQIANTLPAWVHRKLMEPRVFDHGKVKRPEELLRMPKFHFTPEEADAIVTGVMSFTKEQVPLAAQKQQSADEKYIEKGRRLVRNLNCQGCHQIGAKGGTIKAVVTDQLESSGGDVLQAVALSPPMLYNEQSHSGEGARVQTPWLHGFLKDPSNKIRPWLQIHMPTFDFEEEEINAITRYFAALDNVPYPYEPKPTLDPVMVATGRDLFGRWQCARCHVVAGKLPNQEPANMAPDLAKVPERLRTAWIAQWLADPGRIQTGTRMPMNFPVDPSENAYPAILGGDQKKQIEAVRSYLLTLGPPGARMAEAR
jgi:mono/diheme cytochrome c family protein